MASNNFDPTNTDEFTALMGAYDSAMALFDMLDEMEGIVIEDRHAALFHRMFNDMFDAKDEFTEMIENASAENAEE